MKKNEISGTDMIQDQQISGNDKLRPGFGKISIWAFSIGTSIGWGSLVVTCNTYLAQAGVLGTIFGLLIGMLVIFVITRNLRLMISKNPDAGGIYSFARDACGHDYGFLAAWFLLITYFSILWANITSVPLFARYFFGNAFQYGFHYHIFGFEVYFGETLLSICAILLVGFLCAFGRKSTNAVLIGSAVAFVAGFTFCTAWALANHDGTSFGFDPEFLPDSSVISHITKFAVISPWAFIGFENISHFSEEYKFKAGKVRKILIISVAMTTAIYIFVTLLSVTAYPPEYQSWYEYIKDMDNLTGFKAVPAFYAINHYLGNTGVIILMVALLGAIITSLIGNTMALSRLLFAEGRDGAFPSFLKKTNKQGNPHLAVWTVIAVSVFIPFLGRTAIGWIVDVTTLGATIIYGLLSYAVFRTAREDDLKTEKATGIAGLVLMLFFGLMLLLPNLFSFSEMASESYILFDLWALIGLIFFRTLVMKDKGRKYGHSVLVWVILLLFVLFASMMWVTKATQNVTNSTLNDIHNFYQNNPASSDSSYLAEQGKRMHNTNALFSIASFSVFIVSAAIIFSNYQVMRRRDSEHSHQLSLAESRAATDHLTGVRNRRAYAYAESRLDERLNAGELKEFAIVVCDINNLKYVNDNKGHKYGDKCICMSCNLICDIFKRSPVFRIGGDEFVIILEGDDYYNRYELIEELNRRSVEEIDESGSTIAVGMAEYDEAEDDSVLSVFSRADGLMYRRKYEMKNN